MKNLYFMPTIYFLVWYNIKLSTSSFSSNFVHTRISEHLNSNWIYFKISTDHNLGLAHPNSFLKCMTVCTEHVECRMFYLSAGSCVFGADQVLERIANFVVSAETNLSQKIYLKGEIF